MLHAAILLLSSSALCLAAPTMPADGGSVLAELEGVQLDKSKVRYGDLSRFDPDKGHEVGTVRSKDVYAETEEVKTIRKEGIEKGSARYRQLMAAATKKYKAALRAVARAKDYVLVVEEGGIRGYDEHTTDATAAIIRAL